MFQTQMITQVIDWERRLEIEEEKRKNQRGEPYVNYLAAPQDCRRERPSLLARIFRRGEARLRQARESTSPCYPPECCPETQLG